MSSDVILRQVIISVLYRPEFDHCLEEREKLESLDWDLGTRTPAATSPAMEFVTRHPELAGAISDELAMRVIKHVNDQCEYYGEIASCRALTPEEQTVGKELIDLLALLREFIRGQEHPDAETESEANGAADG